jgi:integrase
VIDVGPEVLTAWQSALLDRLAPYTVLSCRKACRQIFAEAVKMGLIATNPFDLVHAPRVEGVKEGRALNAADARKLVTAAAPIRSGVAVTLLFCQGWRVSEVLGLAWDDLDPEAGTAHIRRAATHSTASGVTFGPTKTSGAQGLHHRCSPTRWVGSSIGRRSPRSSSARPNVPGSTQRDWPHTPVDEPSSPRCTPKAGSTCQMSLVMWVIRTSPRPPAT